MSKRINWATADSSIVRPPARRKSKKPWCLGVGAGDDRCHRCGRRVNQLYMLHDRVWAQTGAPFVRGALHIRCAERRLGRKLTRKDFYDGHDPRR